MSLALQCIDRQVWALNGLRSVIEHSNFKVLVNLVANVAQDNYTRRVIIAGVGKNANIASKISETMASLGIPSFSLNITHCPHGDYGMVGPNDVVIHISRSGQTAEMLDVIEHLNLIRPEVIQVLIHCKENKPPNKFVGLEIFIGSVLEGDEFELAPTTSTTAILCFLDCVSVEASHRIGFRRLDFLKFHPGGALGAMLKAEQAPALGANPPDPSYIGMTAEELSATLASKRKDSQ